jgi:hypothetical protein
MHRNILVEITSQLHGTKTLGVVLDYRPDVLGGSGTHSWRQPSESDLISEITHTERRGEVLVLDYSDGSLSWYDELWIKKI